MFYFENKIMTYPNRRVIEDLLLRSGPSTSNDFTPYNGMNWMIKQQFKNSSVHVTPEAILSVSEDFNPRYARPNDDGVDERDMAARDISEGSYYTRLEDIKEEYVERYVRNIIIGFKKNNNGQRRLEYEAASANTYVFDEEGDMEEITDIFPEAMDYSSSDFIEAQEEIPHLLRLLHKGSIEMGVSLLSLIIAHEQWRKSVRNKGAVQPKPRDIYEREVYKVNSRGELTERLTAQINTTPQFAEWKNWIWGLNKDDPYYKAYKQLMTAASILDIDITKEDVKQYTPEVIDNALCLFIQSNSDYIEQFGMVDPRIMKLLEVDNLFTVQGKFSDNVGSESECTGLLDKSQYIVLNMGSVSENVTALRTPRVEEVNKFLRYYYGNVVPEQSRKDVGLTPIKRTTVKNNIICDRDGAQAVMFNIAKLSGVNSQWAVLTLSGHLIAIGQSNYAISYTTVEEAIRSYETKGVACEWKVASL